MSFFRKRKAAREQARRDAEAAREQARKDAEAARELARKIDGLRTFVETLIGPDATLDPKGEELEKYMAEHQIDPEDVPDDLGRTLTLALANGGALVARPTQLLLKQGEVAYIDQDATLLKEVAQKEFRAAQQGISVPLGGGLRYRIGAVRGEAVTVGTEWQTADAGILTVTNHRVVYHGGRKTLEFQFPKLVALTAYGDAVSMGVTNRQTTSTFGVEDGAFVAGMIRAAFIAANP